MLRRSVRQRWRQEVEMMMDDVVVMVKRWR
jgi:hypothetical protein